jgi:glycerol-3-phosphate cytidylyltransferase
MERVITYGTFDLFHIGHLNLLKRAKSYGDYLIVALSTDEFNLNAKGKQSVICYEDRKSILESLRYVDLVIPEKDWSQKVKDIQDFHINTFIMGCDWSKKFDFLKEYCKVIYLPRTKSISSTEIKTHIRINPSVQYAANSIKTTK